MRGEVLGTVVTAVAVVREVWSVGVRSGATKMECWGFRCGSDGVLGLVVVVRERERERVEG